MLISQYCFGDKPKLVLKIVEQVCIAGSQACQTGEVWLPNIVTSAVIKFYGLNFLQLHGLHL